MGEKWDLVGICIGLAWDLEAINDYNMVLCPMCLSVFYAKKYFFHKNNNEKNVLFSDFIYIFAVSLCFLRLGIRNPILT